MIAEYCYDAWGNLIQLLDANGNVLSSGTNYTIAKANPFRYRGYYFDSETGFYYLNSRYYDPQVGRFLNADSIIGANGGLQGYNLFAYCNNNPIILVDTNGYFASTHTMMADGGGRPDKTMLKIALRINKKQFDRSTPHLNSIDKNDFELYLLKSHFKYNDKPFIENFKNEDGSYSLADSKRRLPDSHPYHGQLLVFSGSKPCFDISNGDFTLGSLEFDFVKAGWEFGGVDLSLLDFGHAEISAGIEDGNLNLSAYASAYSPSASATIFGVTIGASAEVGAVGAMFNVGINKFELKGALLFGAGFSIEW